MHALSSHTLINGVSSDQVSVQDRGLLYGDGVFRTLRLQDGCLQYWDRHYRKLQQDCSKLHIQCPEQKLLYEELLTLTKIEPNGIAKIIITRGQQTAHGYRPVQNLPPTRILKMVPVFSYPGRYASQGIKARICKLRLSHQPHLAGIKHLNRLENVLAAAESTLAQLRVEAACIMPDEMGEYLPLHPAREVGAGRGGGNEELRKVPPLDAHVSLLQ